jgi:hypothetical protein
MNTEAPALAAAFAGTGRAQVTSLAFPGWGLTSTSSWRTDWPVYIARTRPEVVIGMWSWDNAAAAKDAAAYGGLLRSALDELLRPGNGVTGVALVEFPKVGQRYGESASQMGVVERQRQAWSAVARQTAAADPGRVAFLPLAPALELGGRYSAWLPVTANRWSRARMIDNTHLCPTGAARLAEAVVASTGPSWHLPPPAATWLGGAWALDARYNDPAGSCPDDQP